MPQQQWVRKKLHITSCHEVYRGQGKNGEYVIYEVQATNEQGVLVNEKLSSFQQLTLGPGEFEVQPYYKDGVLKNYTVRTPGGGGGGSGNAALREDVNFLQQQFKHLEERVLGLESMVQRLSTDVPATPVAAPAANIADDDIPF